jgi:hypothetical protein
MKKSITIILAILLCTSLFRCAYKKAENSSFEITLLGKNNEYNLPYLEIQINKDNVDKGFLYLRFPEVIQTKCCGSNEVLDLYRDGRNPVWPANLQCEPIKLPVVWQGNEKELFYEMKLDNNMVLHSRAKVVDNSIFLEFQLDNNTNKDFVDIDIECCVQSQYVTDISDKHLERTMVLIDGTFRTFMDALPNFREFSDRSKIIDFFHAYTKKDHSPELTSENIFDKPHPGYPDDPERKLRWWIVPLDIDIPVIATLSKDSTWSVATSSGKGINVWHNPVLSCQHVDYSISECKGGKSIKRKITVDIITGGIDALTHKFNIQSKEKK